MNTKPRKTFDVADFKRYVNEQLKRTDEYALQEGFKSGLCVALEEILRKTNNYQGYNSLYWLEIGFQQWLKEGKTEIWEEKKIYVLGTKESKYRGCEYARCYY